MTISDTTRSSQAPQFPACPVKGHGHGLTLVSEHTQDVTGDKAYTIECPTGACRFFFIPTAYARVGSMPRYKRPRWGWGGEKPVGNRRNAVCPGCRREMPLTGRCDDCDA